MNTPLNRLFAGAPVRVVVRDGELWYVAADVAAAFAVKEAHVLIDGIPSEWRTQTVIRAADAPGFRVRPKQRMTILKASAVLMIAGRSRNRTLQILLADEMGRLLRDHLAENAIVVGPTKRDCSRAQRRWRAERAKLRNTGS
jgi:hypothetical protein